MAVLQSAAIQRASRQARSAMYELDAAGAAELLRIYQDGAEQVRGRIAAAVDGTDSVPLENLRELLRQIEAIIDELGAQRDQVLVRSIDQAATLGVRPYTAQGVMAVGGEQAVIASDAAMRIHQDAVRFVREFTQADGLTLSDRLWRLNRGAMEAVVRQLEQAVVQGTSATRAARDFLMRGEPVPGDVARRVMRGKSGELVDAAASSLSSPGGGALAQAERVFRTEINRAHGEAFAAAGEKTPGFGGWRYLLSPRHPAPDICDLLARQNLHGLGPGVYPDRARTPWPAHPNTLSFLEIVFTKEVTEADRAGKETSLEALGRMAPEQRAGALGVTKAQYFDQRLLRPGMIRSTLGAVEQRLQRQGQLPAAE